MVKCACVFGKEYQKECGGFCGDVNNPEMRCRNSILIDDDLKMCEGQTPIEPLTKEELKEWRKTILNAFNIPTERYSNPDAAIAEKEEAYLETIKRIQSKGK